MANKNKEEGKTYFISSSSLKEDLFQSKKDILENGFLEDDGTKVYELKVIKTYTFKNDLVEDK